MSSYHFCQAVSQHIAVGTGRSSKATNRQPDHRQLCCLTQNPLVKTGAGNGVRTRDPELGKLVLYQLSYTRILPHTAHFPTIRQAEILPLLANLASLQTGNEKNRLQ